MTKSKEQLMVKPKQKFDPRKSRLDISNRAKLLAVTMATLAGSTAFAQNSVQEVASLNTRPSVQSAKSINGGIPDISALRYYAVRGEQARVQSEISRLKQLYPTWQQPENIFADGASEEDGLWELFSEGKTDLLKAEMLRLKKQIAGYIPSDELVSKLAQRELRSEITVAVEHQRWDEVIDRVNANPDLLIGDDIELIWFVAEAYAQKERPADSFEAYSAALQSAKSPGERKATIEKAAGLLTTEKALELLELSPELQANSELAGAATDAIVRGALVRNAQLGEPAAPGLIPHIESFAVRARMGKNPDDAALLAWSSFGQRNWKTADEWFNRALAVEQKPKAVEGAIMTSMRLGNHQRAAELAGQWLNISPEIGALFISVHSPELLRAKPRPMDQAFLQTFAAKTAELNNGEGSEALGWYAFNINQLQAAQAWFSKAMQWEETETAAFGLTLTATRMKDRASFDALHASFAPKYAKVAALKYQSAVRKRRPVAVKRQSSSANLAGKLRQKIARLNEANKFSQCLQLTRKLRNYGPLRASDHQMRGWCLLGAKRPAEAERAFAAAVAQGGKNKVPSAYGQALAALRSGKTNQALYIANGNKLTKKQRRVVDIELLTQRARAAFKNKDYGATIYALDQRAKLRGESRDLTLMRAWSHYHSRRFIQARDLFAMVDQQLSTRDSKRGVNAVNRVLSRSAVDASK